MQGSRHNWNCLVMKTKTKYSKGLDQCRKEQDSREDSEESSQLPPGIVDLCVLFQKLYYRTAYGEVYNLLKTYLVIPVSSASSDRTLFFNSEKIEDLAKSQHD